MTTNYHTPIPNGAPANVSEVNAPLSELDTKLTDHEGRISTLENEFPAASGNPTEFLNGDGDWVVPAGTGASIDGHVIKDEGVSLPQRASINFVGAGVTVTNETGGTQVSIPGATNALTKDGLTEWDEQASNPPTPATNKWKLYFKSGGLYIIDDTGAVIGPITTDHGALGGLSDDDHPQYLLSSGLRDWDEQSVNPSTPAANKWKVFFKADGFYIIDDAANVLGPLISVVPNFITGLTLSNNVIDATNDIDIAIGKAADSGNTVLMALTSALTKRLDANWAVGTNQGGLDTGTIANTTYHVFLIRRPDTGVVDALFSTSPTAPTMPANYTQKRRIGSIVRSGATILGFVQDGDDFMWKTPVNELSATNPGTAAVTRTLTLPTGIRVLAYLTVGGTGTGASTDQPRSIYISDLALADATPSNNVGSVNEYSGFAGQTQIHAQVRCYTNTSAQVRSRVQVSTAGTVLYIGTNGWMDRRGQDG